MDRLTPAQRRKNMQAIKCRNIKIEVLLRTELWHRGLRYQKNRTDVYGKPDIVFKGKKIAVFCDSEFFHVYDWENSKNNFKSRQEFWIPKIERNMQRDIEVNEKLAADGWTVIRFWENDITKNLSKCANDVSNVINGKPKVCIGRIYRA